MRHNRLSIAGITFSKYLLPDENPRMGVWVCLYVRGLRPQPRTDTILQTSQISWISASAHDCNKLPQLARGKGLDYAINNVMYIRSAFLTFPWNRGVRNAVISSRQNAMEWWWVLSWLCLQNGEKKNNKNNDYRLNISQLCWRGIIILSRIHFEWN